MSHYNMHLIFYMHGPLRKNRNDLQVQIS